MAIDPLKLARQGNVQAIATLLNRLVQPQPTTLRVNLRGDCLQILLEAEETPEPALLERIQQAVVQLSLPAVRWVRVYGRRQGEPTPDWIEEFEVADLPKPLQPLTPLSRQPFTLSWSDLVALLSRFDRLKLGLITLLALHGWLGAPHYTVVGFLEGRDRVMMFLHGVNLIFHEAGHVIFALFGQFLHILGGSLLQILVPAGIAVYFWWTRQCYASAIALGWMGQNFWDVSIYIKDAQARDLPLLGGEAVLHDWHFLLLDLGLLPRDQLVGSTAFWIGSGVYLAAIAIGLYYAQRLQQPKSLRKLDSGL